MCFRKAVMEQTKRSSVRVETAKLISYTHFDATNIVDALGMGISVDVSEGGIKLRTDRPFPVSAMLGLNLAVGEVIIRATARVVYVSEDNEGGYHIGMKFDEISPADREMLTNLI
jgi:c-di-GMP-binding flagellar brake protein YcgR